MESVVGRGTLLAGRYRTVQPLPSDLPGASGWEATDQILDRPVRVTVLHTGQVPQALDAARRAALVTDPRLVRVLDVGDHDGVAYMVTERVTGPSLAELVARGPLPADQARAIVGEAASALEAARRRGVHHLTLRPSVLHLTPDDRVLVTGLAVDAALLGLDTSDASGATRVDTVGLVGLLYAALTGRWPRSLTAAADAAPAQLEAAPVLEGAPVPPAELASGVPNDLDTLCAVTLGLHDDGPRTPAELVEELEPWGNIRATDLFAGTEVLPVLPPPPPPAPAAPAADVPTTPAQVQRTSVRSVLTAGSSVVPARPGTPPPAVPSRVSSITGPAVPVGRRTDGGTGGGTGGAATAAPATGSSGVAAAAASDAPTAPMPAAPPPPADPVAARPATDRAPDVAPPGPAASSAGGEARTTRLPATDGTSPAAGAVSADGPRPTAPSRPTPPARTTAPAASTATATPPASAPAPATGPAPARPPTRTAPPARTPPPAGPAVPDARTGSSGGTPPGTGDRSPLLGGLGARAGSIDVAAARESIAAHRFDPTRLVLLLVSLVIVAGLFIAYGALTRPLEVSAGSPEPAAIEPTPDPAPEEPTGEEPPAGAEPEPQPQAPPVVPTIASATQLDPPPDGDENEHPEAVPLGIDGDPSTAWYTRTYSTPQFGGLKSGVGYAVTLAEPATVSTVALEVRGTGGRVELRATDPATPTEGPVLAEGTLGPETVLTLTEPTEAQNLVLWFTELPQTPDGSNRVELAEVTVS